MHIALYYTHLLNLDVEQVVYAGSSCDNNQHYVKLLIKIPFKDQQIKPNRVTGVYSKGRQKTILPLGLSVRINPALILPELTGASGGKYKFGYKSFVQLFSDVTGI